MSEGAKQGAQVFLWTTIRQDSIFLPQLQSVKSRISKCKRWSSDWRLQRAAQPGGQHGFVLWIRRYKTLPTLPACHSWPPQPAARPLLWPEPGTPRGAAGLRAPRGGAAGESPPGAGQPRTAAGRGRRFPLPPPLCQVAPRGPSAPAPPAAPPSPGAQPSRGGSSSHRVPGAAPSAHPPAASAGSSRCGEAAGAVEPLGFGFGFGSAGENGAAARCAPRGCVCGAGDLGSRRRLDPPSSSSSCPPSRSPPGSAGLGKLRFQARWLRSGDRFEKKGSPPSLASPARRRGLRTVSGRKEVKVANNLQRQELCELLQLHVFKVPLMCVQRASGKWTEAFPLIGPPSPPPFPTSPPTTATSAHTRDFFFFFFFEKGKKTQKC